MKLAKLGVLGCGLALMVSGCANWGETEPVLGNGGNPYQQPQAQEPPARIMVSNLVEEPATPRSNRELAALRADFDALREEQKLLTARIIGLEQDNLRKDAQIKELQSLLDDMDKRSADVDQKWRNRMTELSTTINSEREARKRELENFSKIIASEIDKNAPAPAAPVNISVITVQKGDTLSGIAAAAKTTTAEIKRLNNLKSDTIYLGQQLKVPVK
ncbi:MAG: LysM peptidoglycan-binding domain-containing protein [Victivallales bacterium]|nr:LysM peptidoglycan-binding domain-containing protein [Victivallales bacterium]